MATTKWIIPFQSLDGTDYRVEIAVEVGTEDAVTLIGGASPIVTEEDDNEDLFIPIRTQSGYVRFVDVDNIWEQVIPASSTARPVFLYKIVSNIKTLMWKGYLQPQTFTGDYIRTPQVRELPICCPLSVLETWDVEATLSAGFVNFASILHYIFSKLGTANPSQSDEGYWFSFQGGSQVEDWLQKRVQWESLIDEDEEGNYEPRYNCLELLEHVCTFFGWVCRIYGKTIYFACPDYATGDFRRMTLSGIEQIANGQSASTTTIQWAEGVLSDGMFASTRNRETIVRGIRKATVEADTGEYDTLLDVPFDKIAKAIRNNTVYSSQYRAAQPASGDDPAVPEGIFFWRHVPYYADQRFGGVLISTRICNSAGLTGPYYQGRIDDYEFYEGGIKDKHNYALTTDLYIVGMAPKGSPDTSNVDVTDTDTTDNSSEGWIISDNDQPAAIGKTVISVSALAVIQTVRTVMLCHGVLVLQGSLQTDYIHSGHDTVSPTGTLSLRISVGDYYFVYFGNGAGYWAYLPDSTLKEGDCWLDIPVKNGRIATTRNLMAPYPAYEGFGMVVQDGYGTSLAGVEGHIKIEVRGWEPTGESLVYGTIYHRDDEDSDLILPNSSIHFDGYGTSNVHISSLTLKFYRHNDYNVHSELSANKYIVAGSEIFRDIKGASTKWYTDNANNYGRNIVINQDGTYCTSLVFGNITDRPEQHLANRIAAYYGVVRRKYELELLTSLMPELTPAHYLTLFGDVLTYPIAFKRDWRDDVTSVTSLVIVGGNDPSVEYATVTLNLTNVSTDYIGNQVVKGESLNIILYTGTGYDIGTVVVTMGETDITSSAYNASTGVISIASVTDNVSITAAGTAKTYNVSQSLDAHTSSNAPGTVTYGTPVTIQLTAAAGYHLSTVSVIMNLVDVTSQVYNSNTGVISIGSVTGAIIITAASAANTYSVTTNLTNCTSDAPNVISGVATLVVELTAASGYAIDDSSVVVTMGGNTLTGVYADGVITIANVTGDISITAVAEEIPALPYDAVVEYLETDGTAYIDTGINTDNTTQFDMKMWLPNEPTNSSIFPFGGRKTTPGNTMEWLRSKDANRWQWRCPNNAYVVFGTSAVNGEYLINNMSNANVVEFSVDGGTAKSITANASTFNTGRNFFLFTVNNNGSPRASQSGIRFSWAKIYSGGTLMRDYIAVRKNGVGYLYDKVSGTLFGNAAASGGFSYGNDVNT